MIITVSEKGQVVIPASLRSRLGISAGMRLEVIEESGNLRLLVEPGRCEATRRAALLISVKLRRIHYLLD